MSFLRDLFCGIGNSRWELARVGGAWGILSYSALFFGVFIRGGQQIDFSSVGIGYATVYGGVAAFIFAKDTARTNAVSQGAQDATAAVAATQPPAPVTKVAGDLNTDNIENVQVQP